MYMKLRAHPCKILISAKLYAKPLDGDSADALAMPHPATYEDVTVTAVCLEKRTFVYNLFTDVKVLQSSQQGVELVARRTADRAHEALICGVVKSGHDENCIIL